MSDPEAYDQLVKPRYDDVSVDEKKGTAEDRADMVRMGKVQELSRNFGLMSMIGFTLVFQSSWEGCLSVSFLGLINGGTAGIIWMTLISCIGFLLVQASMAEMGSMAPTSGGQYHWVSEFAPKRLQKFLSYLVGWVTVFGSLTACAATAYISGTQVQALVILNYPDYDPKMWHSSLLTSAVAAFSVFFNTVLARNLPFIEGVMFVLHIFTFLGIIVALLVLSPRTDAMTVFTQFNDGGGWGDLGVSSLVGASASVLSLMGGDASVHMAEELQDAGRNVPRSMLWSLSIGSGMSWIMMIVYCLCLGDLTDALSTPTGYPFIQVFYNSTQSITAATIMASAVIFMWMFSGMSGVAVTSRMLYAFARDNGLPFSSWFSRVTPVWSIPLNAIVTTFIFTSLVSFIAIGSATALSSFTSLCSSSVLSGYACSISCMIWRRWTNSPLLPSSFSLGQWGLLINISSVLFLLFIIVLGFFPPTPTNVLDCMNWSVIGYAGSIAFCIVYYFLYGRYQYTSPVEHTRKLE